MKLKKWYKEVFERNEFDFIEIYYDNEHYEEGKVDGGFFYPDKLFDMYFSTGEYCSLTLEKV